MIRRMIGRWVKDMLKQAFWAIPFGLVFAALAWFFIRVIASNSMPFLIIWKWSYLALMGVSLLLETFSMVYYAIRIPRAAKRWKMSELAILEAIWDLKVHNDLNDGLTGFFKLSEEEVKKLIQLSKLADRMDKVLFSKAKFRI